MKDSSILDKDNSNQNTMAYAHQSPYHTFNRLLTAGVSLLVLAAAVIFPLTSHAATTAQLYLSPASQSVTNGSNMVFSVILNAGGNTITSARTVVSFSTARFSYVNTTPGSAFGVFPAPTVAGGTIDFTGGAIGGVTGVQTVATITLKAISTGSSTVSLAGVCAVGVYSGCSATYDNSPSADNVLSTIAGGTYTVNAPPVTPPPTTPPPATPPASGGGTKSGTSGTPTTPTTPGAPAAPTEATPDTATTTPSISKVTVTDITDTTATVNWTTDLPSSSIVQYGLSDTHGQTAQSAELVTDHHVTLKDLSKGTGYDFVVSSAVASGASDTSDSQHFTTTGFDVTILVVDEEGNPIANATVTLNGVEAKTDSAGIATFKNVPAGKQVATLKGSKSKTITIGAYKDGTKDYQEQVFSLTARKHSGGWAYVLLTVLLLSLVAWLVVPRGRGSNGGGTGSSSSGGGNNPVQKIKATLAGLASKVVPQHHTLATAGAPSTPVTTEVPKLVDPNKLSISQLESLVEAKTASGAEPLPKHSSSKTIHDWLGRRVQGPAPGATIHPEPKDTPKK